MRSAKKILRFRSTAKARNRVAHARGTPPAHSPGCGFFQDAVSKKAISHLTGYGRMIHAPNQ
ncbi:hypothetical protein IH879_16525 [candidate division KSB1 bacterium]|nr:hypothetical protein [candidate division KSB1 bacterium]